MPESRNNHFDVYQRERVYQPEYQPEQQARVRSFRVRGGQRYALLGLFFAVIKYDVIGFGECEDSVPKEEITSS
jgi:hypothetical protein